MSRECRPEATEEILRLRLDASLCCVSAEPGTSSAESLPFAQPGKHFPDFLDPSDAGTIVDVFDRVIEESLPASIVASFDLVTGALADALAAETRAFLWLEMTVSPLASGAEDGAAIEIVFRDVTSVQTERAELERRVELEALVGELTRNFLSADGDRVERIIEEGLRRVARAMSARRVSLLCDPAGLKEDPFTFMFESGSPPSIRIPLRRGAPQFPWCARQIAKNGVIEIFDVAALPTEARVDREILESLGAASVLSVPAHSNGQIVGILTVHGHRVVEAFREDEKRLLRIVAEVCTGALARRRSEQELRESEERFRALAENTRDGICEIGEDGRILYASPSHAEMLGESTGSLAGRSPLERVHSEDRPRVESLFRPGGRSRRKGTIVYRAQNAQGRMLDLEASAREFLGQDGRPRVVVVTRDVTERAEARRALERQIELETRVAELSRFFLDCDLEEIREGIDDRLAVVGGLADAQHSWMYSFATGVDGFELFDWWGQEPEGREPAPAANARIAFPYSTALIMQGQVYRVPDVDALPEEAVNERLDMLRRGVRSILSIPIMTGGEFVGVLGFESYEREIDWSNETITLLRVAGEIFFSALRRRRASWDLRDSQSQLLQAQKMEAVGTLAGGIAHDFNNHLAVMLANARFVRQEVRAEPEVIEAIEDFERAADHCAGLTRSLLAFSRRSPVEIVPVDAEELVRSVEGLVRPLLPATFGLDTQLEPRLGSFEADRVQIQQVLVNLLVNARDAMPEGGPIGMHACRRRASNTEATAEGIPEGREYVILRVTDAGCGMDAETRSRIFEPFYTTKKPGSGTGLGLATAYGIVRQTGGAISVESEPGQGSTFRVYLPVAGPSALPD